ncbi:MAG: uroporphyrinogen decarboxylase family protein [Planctomycetota bacterium]|jgi:uroporphyrinogen decarboxylase
MASLFGLQRPYQPDWQGLLDNIGRKGTPARVYNIELFHDPEIVDAVVERFGLASGLDPNSPDCHRKRLIALQRFCGLDYVRVQLDLTLTFHRRTVEDTAALRRAGGREYQDEHTGPIMSWEDFEKYRWPDPNEPAAARDLYWYQENLPDDMCLIGGTTGHFCERLIWLMGYEHFCYALYERRDLVEAIAERLREFYTACVKRYLECDRVEALWVSDDMGYKTGLFFSPDDMRRLVLASHQALAKMVHDSGRLYLLHACGNLSAITDDLIEVVKIDAKHSFEDISHTWNSLSRSSRAAYPRFNQPGLHQCCAFYAMSHTCLSELNTGHLLRADAGFPNGTCFQYQ